MSLFSSSSSGDGPNTDTNDGHRGTSPSHSQAVDELRSPSKDALADEFVVDSGHDIPSAPPQEILTSVTEYVELEQSPLSSQVQTLENGHSEEETFVTTSVVGDGATEQISVGSSSGDFADDDMIIQSILTTEAATGTDDVKIGTNESHPIRTIADAPPPRRSTNPFLWFFNSDSSSDGSNDAGDSNNIPLSSSSQSDWGLPWEGARDLDESYVPLPGTLSSWTLVRELPLPPLYQQTEQRPVVTTTTTTTTAENLSSQPSSSSPGQTSTGPPKDATITEHLEGLADELRRVAVSVAGRVESAESWCQDVAPALRRGTTGAHSTSSSRSGAREDRGVTRSGIEALVETLQRGAAALRDQQTPPSDGKADAKQPHIQQQQQEELLQCLDEASRACRILRDLCALTPELAAVLTDSLLRLDRARGGTVLTDLGRLVDEDDPLTLQFQRGGGGKGSARWRRKSSSSAKRRAGPSVSWRASKKNFRYVRHYCRLYVTQLLLAMTVASDEAVNAIRVTPNLRQALVKASSFEPADRRRHSKSWRSYPTRLAQRLWPRRASETDALPPPQRPFRRKLVKPGNDLKGNIQRTANQVLASIGYNPWVPKTPGQRGIRILCLDGGGARGMTAVTAVQSMVEAVGVEVGESFDFIVGTSTGAIIAFLVGLRQETSTKAIERYYDLIKQIFVKSALSTPLLLFTTASYDESFWMDILSKILRDEIMLDSRSDPSIPLVFAVTSKMSSIPTHVALFRNYNYAGDELPDPFLIDPTVAREELGLPPEHEPTDPPAGYNNSGKNPHHLHRPTADGSRHPGSFRVLQRYALRASTAAPTFFKPVMMGGEMYADGGMVASNPTAVAIHEARTVFPDIPIELVVSIGTGGFYEQKSPPRIGWDGIIGQIVASATDGEQVHHVLEDLLGDKAMLGPKTSLSGARYFRFNPIIGFPDEYPIDVTEPSKLQRMQQITREFMKEPEQVAKLEQIGHILKGRTGWRRWFRRH